MLINLKVADPGFYAETIAHLAMVKYRWFRRLFPAEMTGQSLKRHDFVARISDQLCEDVEGEKSWTGKLSL